MPTLEELEKIYDNSIKAFHPPKTDFLPMAPKPFWEVSPPEVAANAAKKMRLGGETLIGRIIDVLSRGEYASVSVAKDYLLGKPFDAKKASREFFTPKERGSYPELIASTFPEWSPWKQKALGFALSIFADPTTYIPMPSKTIRKGLKGVRKGIAKSPIGEFFIPGAKLPEKYYGMKRSAIDELHAKRQWILDDIKDLKKGLSEKDMERLTYYRQHPDEIGNLPLSIREKLDEIGNRFDSLIDNAVKSGTIDPDTAAKWRSSKTPYVPGYYPKRGIRIAKGQIPPDLFEKNKAPTFMKKKVFKTIDEAKKLSDQMREIAEAKTTDEIKEKIATYGFEKLFTKGQVQDVKELKSYAKVQSEFWKPEENILKIYAIRAIEDANFTARKQFVDNVLANPQLARKVKFDTKVVPEGFGLYLPKGAIRFYGREAIDVNILDKMLDKFGEMIPADELYEALKKYPSVTKKVPKYMMPKEVAKDMNRGMSFFYGDPQTRRFWQLFDKGQNAWKGMATVVRLPFHLRNMYSNWWQAWLSGVNNPLWFSRAAQVQFGKLDHITLGGKVYSTSELKKAIDKYGIHGRGWVGADIPKSMYQELESVIRGGFFQKVNPMEVGRHFGVTIEDNARIAVFLNQVNKGKSFEKASETVRKYLFDYSELTDFEKKVMRRIFPFYTWSRKNIPLQIENILTQPRKYQVWAKGQRAFQDLETEEEKLLKPKYFKEILYIKSPFKSKQGKPMYMSFDLPPLEFNRMSSVRHWLSSTTPYKIFAEVGLNFKLFPEVSNIKSYPKDFARAPFWVMYLPEKMQDVMAKHQIIGPIVDYEKGGYVMGMDKKWRHAIQSVFPFLNELNRIYAQPISLSDESPSMKWKSYLSGVGISALDIDLQRKRDVLNLMGTRMKNVRKYLRQHGEYAEEGIIDELLKEK